MKSVDDVIVLPDSESLNFEEMLRSSLERLGDIAKRRNLKCPASVRLVDSDMRNLAKYVLLKFELQPDAVHQEKIESDIPKSEAGGELRWPIFWVVEGADGQIITIRIQLKSQPPPA